MSFDEEWRAIAKSRRIDYKKKKFFGKLGQFFPKILQDPFKTPTTFKLRHRGYNFPKIHRIQNFPNVTGRFKRYEKILSN